MELSQEKLLKCFKNADECSFLDGVYEDTIRSAIQDNFHVDCPPLVSQLISQLAHGPKEFQQVLKEKLLYRYYYDTHFGFKSPIYRRFRIPHIMTNGWLIADRVICSIQYMMNNHVIWIPISFLPFLIHGILHESLWMKNQALFRQIKRYKIHQLAHDAARDLEPYPSEEHVQKTRRIVDYYDSFHGGYRLEREESIDYVFEQAFILNARAFFTYFLLSRIRTTKVKAFLDAVGHFIASLSVHDRYSHFAYQYQNRYRKNSTAHRQHALYTFLDSISRVLMNTEYHSKLNMLQQISFAAHTVHMMTMQIPWPNMTKDEKFLVSMYGVGGACWSYAFCSGFIGSVAPAWYFHFGYEALPYSHLMKAVSVVMYALASFVHLGHHTLYETGRVRGYWTETRGRDIFEWIYLKTKWIGQRTFVGF